ncbi:MAG: hypothetical protein KGZ30_03605 [Anaplasmataceae bacterium]|nr:hypothetical protein [Anaplasmataceae bacterium]
MTKYQSYQHPFWFKTAIIILITVIGGVSLYLISVYSRLVTIEHDITSAKKSFKEVMIESATLQSQIFELATDDSLHQLAAAQGLVLDNNPSYFEVPDQWLFATHY